MRYRDGRRRHQSMRGMVVVIAIALTLAACSSNSGETSFNDIAMSPGEESAGTMAAGGAAEQDDSGTDAEAPRFGTADSDQLGDGGIEPVVFQISDLGRDIIFTAELTVAVSDVAAAGDEATREIQSLGGFLFGQRTTGGPEPRSILTFKVQPEDFQTALDRLGTIGELRTQIVSADDVTERIVDLESRIQTAAASVERLRGLLAAATDIKSIVELEAELLERETQLESLRGSLRTLQDQVTLATIVLTLTEAASNPAIAVNVTAYPSHDEGLSCPGDGQLVIEQGTEATVCFEIVNAGDTWLTDFDLRDPVLDVELGDLIVVFGDLDRPIEPGESIVLAAEVQPSRDLRTRTTVTANPVTDDGSELPGRPASTTATMFIQAADPGGLPTFGEGLEASWNLLVSFGQLIVLIAGAVIPFIWVPILAWIALRTWRRRPPQAQTE